MVNPIKCDEIQKNHITFPINHDHMSDTPKIQALEDAQGSFGRKGNGGT